MSKDLYIGDKSKLLVSEQAGYRDKVKALLGDKTSFTMFRYKKHIRVFIRHEDAEAIAICEHSIDKRGNSKIERRYITWRTFLTSRVQFMEYNDGLRV